MLAVIQQDEHPFVLQIIAEHVDHRALRLVTQADGDRRGAGHQQGIEDRSQLHQPDAGGIVIQQFACGPDRETRFARPSRADKREQVGIVQKVLHIRQLFLTAHKAGYLNGQVVGEGIRGTKRREFLEQAGGDHLEETHGKGRALEGMCAHISQAG